MARVEKKRKVPTGRGPHAHGDLILMYYACRMKPADIRRAMKEHHNLLISEGAIRGYSPYGEEFRRHPEWQATYKKCRERYLAEIEQFAIAHKRGRIEALQTILDEAMQERVVNIIPSRTHLDPPTLIKAKDLTNATRAIDLARREEGDRLTLDGKLGVYPTTPEPDYDAIRKELKKTPIFGPDGQPIWEIYDAILEAARKVEGATRSPGKPPGLPGTVEQ